MDEATARKHLNNFLLVLQKLRSIKAENEEGYDKAESWIYGPKGDATIMALTNALDKEGHLNRFDFCNFMAVLSFADEGGLITIESILQGFEPFPSEEETIAVYHQAEWD